ncbi:MAG TPA: glycoside hydrolase family 43 protein [Cyclobacteriaceae bacterium]
MRNFIYVVLMAMMSSHVMAQSHDDVLAFAYFKNNGEDGLHLAYSNDGYTWKALKNDQSFLTPEVSKDKLMRDPCIIRGADGLFHMVWTVSWNDKGIGYSSSKDLISWSPQQFIPVMAKEDGARNCWAPEITYDRSSGLYMIYWATTITGKFPETQSSKESSYNHRIYYVTTKDFKTFSDTRLLYNPGFNSIDATIIPEGKQFIMFLKDESTEPPQKNIKLAFSKSLTGPYSAASAAITGKYWAEGPTVMKTGSNYIMYFDKYTEHRYGALSSTDLKTWVDVSDKIKLPDGLRHGTIFKISNEELAKLLKQ